MFDVLTLPVPASPLPRCGWSNAARDDKEQLGFGAVPLLCARTALEAVPPRTNTRWGCDSDGLRSCLLLSACSTSHSLAFAPSADAAAAAAAFNSNTSDRTTAADLAFWAESLALSLPPFLPFFAADDLAAAAAPTVPDVGLESSAPLDLASTKTRT